MSKLKSSQINQLTITFCSLFLMHFLSNSYIMTCHGIIDFDFSLHSGTYGVVDYTNPEDMKYAVSFLKINSSFFLIFLCLCLCITIAIQPVMYSSFIQIRKLDDTEFRNPWARGRITVPFYPSFLSSALKKLILVLSIYSLNLRFNLLDTPPSSPHPQAGETVSLLYHNVCKWGAISS